MTGHEVEVGEPSVRHAAGRAGADAPHGIIQRQAGGQHLLAHIGRAIHRAAGHGGSARSSRRKRIEKGFVLHAVAHADRAERLEDSPAEELHTDRRGRVVARRQEGDRPGRALRHDAPDPLGPALRGKLLRTAGPGDFEPDFVPRFEPRGHDGHAVARLKLPVGRHHDVGHQDLLRAFHLEAAPRHEETDKQHRTNPTHDKILVFTILPPQREGHFRA